jgi:hypothetical protein
MNASSASISGLTANLDSIKTSLGSLSSSASSEFQAQTSALKSDLNGLKSAVTKLTKSPSASAITDVKTEAEKVSAAGRNLEAAVKSHCGT